jgi:hypothetical protein
MITIQTKSGATQCSSIQVNRVDARVFLGGIPERTFFKLEAEGVLIPSYRGGRGKLSVYDLATITPAYIAHLKAISPVGGERESRARRDQSQAELNELRLAERKKELLPRDQVVREGRAAVIAVRAKLLAMPRRMVQAGHIPVEKQPAVAAMIRETLEEMGRWKTQHDLLAAKGAKRNAATRRPRTGSRRSPPLPPSP